MLFFTMTDCPLANGYVPEMNRMRAAYDPRGVAFYAVQVDNTVSDADVKKYAQEFGYSFPMLNDPRLVLAHLTGAKVTPEVAVLSPNGEVLDPGPESTTRWRILRIPGMPRQIWNFATHLMRCWRGNLPKKRGREPWAVRSTWRVSESFLRVH